MESSQKIMAKSVLTYGFGMKNHCLNLGFTLLHVMGRPAYTITEKSRRIIKQAISTVGFIKIILLQPLLKK